MKKKSTLLFGIIGMLMMVGCTATLPNGNLSGTDYSGADYTVIGPVKGEATARTLFGGLIILEPDAGYRHAYRDALSEAPDADALINVYSDVQITQYVFGLYIEVKTEVYGTAIQTGATGYQLSN